MITAFKYLVVLRETQLVAAIFWVNSAPVGLASGGGFCRRQPVTRTGGEAGPGAFLGRPEPGPTSPAKPLPLPPHPLPLAEG